MPGRSYCGPLPALTQEEAALRTRLEGHVRVMADDIGDRCVVRYDSLEACARYIDRMLRETGMAVARQEFTVEGKKVRNLEVELRGKERPEELVILGAHYDSVFGCPAANDNASGVAAMLEIVRLLAGKRLARTVRFVAFVNEEPPYYRTGEMGSLVYARRSSRRGEQVVAMLSLETIGYYTDVKGSQQYPFPFNLFYPSTGNFVAFVGNVSSRGLVRRAIGSFRSHTSFPSEGAATPGWITGVGWSDHWSFWEEGYPAIMVTDTAPFRYPYYHSPYDTPDKLDYDRLARVTAGLARVVIDLAEPVAE